MKFTFNITTAIILLLLIGVFFYMGKCSMRDNLDQASMALLSARDSIVKDSIVIDGLKSHTFQQNLTIISNSKTINDLQGEKERLKALHIKDVLVIGELNAKIARLNVQLDAVTDPVVIIQVEGADSSKYLKIPQEYKFNDQWGWANVYVNHPKTTLSYGIHNLPLHVTIGEQRDGLFKKTKSVIIVDTPNPFVTINKADIILVQPPKPFWKRPLVWLGGGFLLGSVVL